MYAWDVDPQTCWERYLFRTSNTSAEATVDDGRGKFIDLANGHRVLQLYRPVEIALERAAHNTVLPLGRGSNKMANGVIKYPPRLHYPTPAAGERVPMRDFPRTTYSAAEPGERILLRRLELRRFHVSHRSQFNTQK